MCDRPSKRRRASQARGCLARSRRTYCQPLLARSVRASRLFLNACVPTPRSRSRISSFTISRSVFTARVASSIAVTSSGARRRAPARHAAPGVRSHSSLLPVRKARGLNALLAADHPPRASRAACDSSLSRITSRTTVADHRDGPERAPAQMAAALLDFVLGGRAGLPHPAPQPSEIGARALDEVPA